MFMNDRTWSPSWLGIVQTLRIWGLHQNDISLFNCNVQFNLVPWTFSVMCETKKKRVNLQLRNHLKGKGMYILISPLFRNTKHWLPIKYHDHIWQASPHLWCVGTCQMSTWFEEYDIQFCLICCRHTFVALVSQGLGCVCCPYFP